MNNEHADRPKILCEQINPALTVRDIHETVDFYTQKLGFSMGFLWGDPPEFAGVNLDTVGLHFALGTPQPVGCHINFTVDDVDTLYEFHHRNGVQITAPPEDMDWGMRAYQIHDINGYEIGFGQYIYNMGPKLEVERIDVTVRLETRLAALLHDLAAHKRMTIGEALEETLLHTFETVDHDGVASPHTKTTLRVIEDLRQKHGIDYDSHGSYRFVERGG